MRRWLLAAGLVGALGWVVVTPALAAELVVVTPADLAITLPAGGATTIDVPLAVADGVVATGLQADVVGVRRGGVPVGGDAGVGVELPAGMGMLRVAVAEDALQRQGAYTVTVLVRSGQQRQLLPLTLTRPAAQLRIPATVAVEREVWFPELGGGPWLIDVTELPAFLRPDDEAPPLSVVNTGEGPLRSLDPVRGEAMTDGVAVTVGEGLADPLAPDEALELDYQVVGNPPLGTVNRSVELRSPQLADPVIVTFAITTRRSPWLIGLLVVLGLLLGWLLRKALPWISRRLATRSAQIRLLAEFDELNRRYRHQRLTATIAEHRSLIQAAHGLEQREWRLRGATTAVNAAIEQLRADVAPLRQRADDHARLLRAAWQITGPAADRLPALRERVDGLAGPLDRGDVGRAEADLAVIDADVRALLAEVDDETARYASELSAVQAPLRSYEATFQAPRRRVERLHDVATAAVEQPPEQLDRLHRVVVGLQPLWDEVLEAAAIMPEQLGGTDVAANAVPTAELKAVRAAVRRGDLHRRLMALPPALVALKEAVGDDLLGHAGTDVAATAAPVEAPTVERPLLGPGLGFVPLPRHVSTTLGLIGTAGLRGFVDLARTVLLGALLIALTYGWFVDDWTGTAAQMIAIVGWAFGVDLTVEALTRYAKEQPVLSGFPGPGGSGASADEAQSTSADEAMVASSLPVATVPALVADAGGGGAGDAGDGAPAGDEATQRPAGVAATIGAPGTASGNGPPAAGDLVNAAEVGRDGDRDSADDDQLV